MRTTVITAACTMSITSPIAILRAEAGTASSQLGVSVTVAATCSIAAGSMAFGSYDALGGGQVDGAATLSVACTKGAAAAITLGQGEHPGVGSTDTTPQRRMSSGTDFLSYELYTDALRTSAWGNTGSTGKPYVAPSGLPSEITLYGRIGARQDVHAGAFTDLVVATITF
jgi:spore coat protein U-like protein